tara:strand:- start:212 stop:892 length:681 start_codon:yes stop_codon:yes gene_type:complete
MLALKQGLSLVSTNILGGWQPSNETGLKAWYKYQTGITLQVANVYGWADSSENSFDMRQVTASEQPAYNSGDISFDASKTQNLGSSSDITLSGAFTIGMKINVQSGLGVPLASNAENGEFFRFTSTTQLRVRIDNTSAVNLELDSETWGDGYMVVTRDGSNVITLYWDGVKQTTATPTLSGTANIDTIGVRKTDLNPYDGSISEIQIFDTESSAITANVNTYLSNI